MNDARAAIIEALMRLMGQPQMPPAQPEMKFGINVRPVPQEQQRPPLPAAGGIRG